MIRSFAPAEPTLDDWRALAEARQRQLEELRARLLAAIETIPDEHVRAFISALDPSRPSWLRELDSMTTSIDLEPSDVITLLDELWRHVAADCEA